MFNLSINNFRSFLNQDFNFSRINILIGENSGGKSSLLKFLLSLKQTLDSPLESNLKLKGDYTDLANYKEVIYNKNSNNLLEFSFSDTLNYINFFKEINNEITEKQGKVKIQYVIEKVQESETKISFQLNDKLDNHSSIKTIIENTVLGKIEIIQIENQEETFKYRDCQLKVEFKNITHTFNDIYGFKEGFFTFISGDLFEKIKKEDLANINADELFGEIAFLLFFQNYISEKIENIRFVNPIGNNPKRFYFQEDKKSSYKLIDIEKFINILGDKNLSEKEQNERIKLLNKTIREFGIAEEIRLVQHKDIPILTLEVKTKGYWANITDVGYGVSLQIPILFQALLSEHYSRKEQTILIEQPEVHLHPTLQAKFIETLLSIGDKNSYFIETHSEHIVRKLQVLIKNKFKGLTPNDISIYYFKRTSEKFEITEHKILESGKLSNQFPNGFFDTSYSLVKELF